MVTQGCVGSNLQLNTREDRESREAGLFLGFIVISCYYVPLSGESNVSVLHFQGASVQPDINIHRTAVQPTVHTLT